MESRMSFIVLISILFISNVSSTPLGSLASDMHCPDGYSLIYDTCYMYGSSELTWNEAKQACNEQSGWLASVHSAAENNRIFNWVLEHDYKWRVFYEGPFMGMYWDEDLRRFAWENGDPLNFTNWEDRYPSHDGCIVLTSYATWYNTFCDDANKYICETDMIASPSAFPTSNPTPSPTPLPTIEETIPVDHSYPPSENCPSGFIELDNSCYYLSYTKNTWHEAKYICQSLTDSNKEFQSSLVTIESEEENSAIYKWLQSTFNSFDVSPQSISTVSNNYIGGVFIGLHRYDSNRVDLDSFQWSVDYNNQSGIQMLPYENWYQSTNPSLDCAVISLAHDGEWLTYNCYNKMEFICESNILISNNDEANYDTLFGFSYTTIELFAFIIIIMCGVLVYYLLSIGCFDFRNALWKSSSNFDFDIEYDPVETTSTHFLVRPSTGGSHDSSSSGLSGSDKSRSKSEVLINLNVQHPFLFSSNDNYA